MILLKPMDRRGAMFKGFLFFIVTSILFFAAGCAKKQKPVIEPEKPKSFPPQVSPNDFVILAWSWVPADPDILEGIRECGFNLAGFVKPDGLDAVHQAGLQCIVSDSKCHAYGANLTLDDTEIERRVLALTAQCANHPATFGYYLRDEPPSTDYLNLARWSKAFLKADPDALPYINLFPNYVSLDAMKSWGLTGYEDYIDKYIEIVKPPFISYDHYALMEDGTLRYGYFQNLETIRAASLKNNVPFWNIVLSNAHFQYAEPSPAGFRFQAYTTLAYGARGISYFTYLVSNTGNYRLSPIDQFRHKTPTWDMLQNVNLQIQKLVPVYIQLKSVNVFHHPEIPDQCHGLDSSVYVKSIEGGGNYVVGEFKGPGNDPYIMVVNKDLHKSFPFSVSFKEKGDLFMINSYSGKTSPWVGENNWLAAGQGMLLKLKRK